MKKLLSLFLLVATVCVLSVNAAGIDNMIHPRWDDASVVDCNLYFISGSRSANFYAKITDYSGTTRNVTTVTLYQSSGNDLTYMTTAWLSESGQNPLNLRTLMIKQ